MRTNVLPRIIKFSFLSLFSCVLTGCITTIPIQKLPTTPEAFRLPPDQLRAAYPEILLHEPSYKDLLNLGVDPLGAKQLISTWGEPDHKKVYWVYPAAMGATLIGCGIFFGPVPAIITAGIVVAIRPYPPEYYYWRKDDYCIEALLDHSIVNVYNGSMVKWNWHHISDGKDIPTECGKLEKTIITEKSK